MWNYTRICAAEALATPITPDASAARNEDGRGPQAEQDLIDREGGRGHGAILRAARCPAADCRTAAARESRTSLPPRVRMRH